VETNKLQVGDRAIPVDELQDAPLPSIETDQNDMKASPKAPHPSDVRPRPLPVKTQPPPPAHYPSYRPPPTIYHERHVTLNQQLAHPPTPMHHTQPLNLTQTPHPYAPPPLHLTNPQNPGSFNPWKGAEYR